MKLNDRVEILFWDHVENGDEPMKCTVIGEIKKIKKGYYVVYGWKSRKDLTPPNSHYWTIVRSTILKQWRLKRCRREK